MRTTTISILAGGLLAASAGVVTAQQEGPSSPTYFTGGVAEPGRVVEPEVTEGELGWTMSGQEVYDIPFEMSDPRISGTFSFFGQGAGGGPLGDDAFVEYDSKTYRIDNDAGWWEGEGFRLSVSGQIEDGIGIETMQLTGGGDHEGLYAYVVVDFTNDPPVRGIITSLEPAVFPEPVPPPAE